MSITSEINRILENIRLSYEAVLERGGSVPEVQNSDNLPDAIKTCQGLQNYINTYTIQNINRVIARNYVNRGKYIIQDTSDIDNELTILKEE